MTTSKDTAAEAALPAAEDPARDKRAAEAQEQIAKEDAQRAPAKRDELHGPTPGPDTPDVGEAEIQSNFDQITDQGYVGTVPDEKPNSEYTVPSHGGKE